jgi:uncharacterized OB-fold protein
MSDGFARPVPHPTPDTQPHWDGLARGEYLIQRCRDCGKLRHYPRPVCDGCWSMAHDWVPASGRGTLHSWTVCHHPFHIGFKARSPYVLVTVALEEGVRAIGQLRELGPDDLRLGLELRIGFEQEGDGPVLAVFRPPAS